MTATHTLSFQQNISVLDHEDHAERYPDNPGRQYRSIEARPLVDGLSIVEGYVFDALTILAYGCRSGDIDLFTCSCGIAGCAGIFEDARIEVTDTQVLWIFPEEPFRARFNPELFPLNEPLTLGFERGHYERALTELEQSLLATEAAGELPVSLAPDFLPDLEEDLAAQLAGARARVDNALRTRYLPRSDIDAAIDLFEQLKQYAHQPERIARCERQVGDIRELMENASLQAPGTAHQLNDLAERIRRESESDEDALLALFELVPYLTGANGPYTIEFQHDGRPLRHVRKTLEGWDVRDENDTPLALELVFIILRRRHRSMPVWQGALILAPTAAA